MPLLPVSPPPGICLSVSPYGAGKDSAYIGSGASAFRTGSGRWTDATNVEFIAGFPQKIAGWSQATTSLTVGIPRANKIWREASGNIDTAIGTDSHLYYLQGSTLTDITPWRDIVSGTLTNAITTTNNSDIVAITDASQQLVNGDWVFLSSASAVGGIQLNGWYQVSSRTGTGYDITFSIPATSSAGPGGGTISFAYPRITLTNPFTTTMGSNIVEVHHVASGATAGGYVIFGSGVAPTVGYGDGDYGVGDYGSSGGGGSSPVGGLTISGEYQIQTIIDANNYTIMAVSSATSSATGGGSVSVVYDIIVPKSGIGSGIGYGTGAYGVGAYGPGAIVNSVPDTGWALDNYGYQLLAAPIGGTIYVFDPAFGGRAYPLVNAPATMVAMFVTPERFVVALGINGNLLEMAWCDQNDYTDWTTTPTNTANTGRTLIGGSYFVGGIGIRDGVSLILSDKCCFQMNYTGGQEIYSTPQIGDNCGLIDITALACEGGIAYWMSDQDWWSWNGGVQVLPSDDVRAYVYQANLGVLNRAAIAKSTGKLNRAKRQMRWWFPAGSATENSFGVIYQYDQQCWSLMGFGKSCGVDGELLPTPVNCDITGAIYYDETGVDANGTVLPYSLKSGEMDVSNGDKNVDVFGFIPDFQYLAQPINLNIQTSYYPDVNVVETGPFALTTSTGRQDFRVDGKLFSFSLDQEMLGSNFRLSVPRVDAQPSGARR